MKALQNASFSLFVSELLDGISYKNVFFFKRHIIVREFELPKSELELIIYVTVKVWCLDKIDQLVYVCNDKTWAFLVVPDKESACNAEAQGTWVQSLGQEDFPGEGNGNPPQYSCLGNTMERGARQAMVLGVTKSRMQLST